MQAKCVLCVEDDADTRDMLRMLPGFSDFEAVPDADAALRLKDESSRLASDHSPGEETFAVSARPTARLLERAAAPGSITEGTTRHLQAQERKR